MQECVSHRASECAWIFVLTTQAFIYKIYICGIWYGMVCIHWSWTVSVCNRKAIIWINVEIWYVFGLIMYPWCWVCVCVCLCAIHFNVTECVFVYATERCTLYKLLLLLLLLLSWLLSLLLLLSLGVRLITQRWWCFAATPSRGFCQTPPPPLPPPPHCCHFSTISNHFNSICMNSIGLFPVSMPMSLLMT